MYVCTYIHIYSWLGIIGMYLYVCTYIYIVHMYLYMYISLCLHIYNYEFTYIRVHIIHNSVQFPISEIKTYSAQAYQLTLTLPQQYISPDVRICGVPYIYCIVQSKYTCTYCTCNVHYIWSYSLSSISSFKFYGIY